MHVRTPPRSILRPRLYPLIGIPSLWLPRRFMAADKFKLHPDSGKFLVTANGFAVADACCCNPDVTCASTTYKTFYNVTVGSSPASRDAWEGTTRVEYAVIPTGCDNDVPTQGGSPDNWSGDTCEWNFGQCGILDPGGDQYQLAMCLHRLTGTYYQVHMWWFGHMGTPSANDQVIWEKSGSADITGNYTFVSSVASAQGNLVCASGNWDGADAGSWGSTTLTVAAA